MSGKSRRGRRLIDGWPRRRRDIEAVWDLVDLARRADLRDAAGLDDADLRRHRHGLDLIMGDVEKGRAELDLDALELEPQFGAQLRVERGQRLVHEEDGGPAHQRAADRHALHLAAREIASRGCRASPRFAKAQRSPLPCA